MTATGGQKLDLKVAAVSKPDKFNPLGLGDVTIARQAFDSAFAEERERYGLLPVTAPRSPSWSALAPYADVKLQSKSEFVTDQSAWVDQILGIFYVLLGLAGVSLFGIVNTLALSVLERASSACCGRSG